MSSDSEKILESKNAFPRRIAAQALVTDARSGASMHITPNNKSALIFNEKGDLIRAQLTPQGYREISRAHLLKPTSPFGERKCAWTPPAYADRHVFARNDAELVCASLAAKP